MLTVTEKVLFLLLAAGTLYFGAKKFYQVYRVIARGKPEDRFDNLGGSIWRALGVVLTQQSVFKARPVISFFHGLVFYGFVFYLLVNLVDVIEGLFGVRTTGTGWSLYNLSADLMTAAVLVGIVALIVRRYWARPRDFAFPPNVPVQPEVRPGIARDSFIVAVFIMIHVGSRLLYKAAELAQYGADPFMPVSSLFAGIFSPLNPSAIAVLHHLFWWGAFGSILLFIPYFPRSKHLHIFMAPINLALKKAKPGVLQPMDFEKEEVFGVAKLEEFTWPRLMDSYSCIMCNRCQDVCPASVTGKALSPAAILINERYELNKIASFVCRRRSESPAFA